jgi:hypothetical protein
MQKNTVFEHFLPYKLREEPINRRILRLFAAKFYKSDRLLVRPGNNAVLPVMGEPITNKDGKETQDCEHEAGKRWLLAHGKENEWLNVTLLGDDLYSDQPFCELVLAQKMSFLFTCTPDSHRWLSETVEQSYLEEKAVKKWAGRYHHTSTYRWINGVPLRDSKDALMVNYLSVEIWNEKTGKVGYRNRWITDKAVTGVSRAERQLFSPHTGSVAICVT